MKTSYIVSAIGILVLVAILFGLSQFLGDDLEDTVSSDDPGVEEPADSTPPITITAKRQFENGVHTIAGTLDMPTPCHLLDWGIIVAESFPEQVTVAFTLDSQAEACAQVITEGRFKFEVEVSENATFGATINGRRAILNLIDVAPGEDLDDFELFEKG